MRFFLLIGVMALLSACADFPTAPWSWQKNGGTQDGFSRDNYTCLQESQQQQSVANVNQVAATSVSGVVTNRVLFNSCMNAAGWYFRQETVVVEGVIGVRCDRVEYTKVIYSDGSFKMLDEGVGKVMSDADRAKIQSMPRARIIDLYCAK